jgi:Uma2 family endonuclease
MTELWKRDISVADYLNDERTRAIRHEYVGGLTFPMCGANERHNQLVGNLVVLLRLAGRGSSSRIYANTMLVQAADDLFYYPDIVVLCDPSDDHPGVKRRPCLVVEVLSPSTASVDRREKLRAYRQIASMQAIMLVQQDAQRIELHLRAGDQWKLLTLIGDGAVSVPCINAELQMADIYADVFSLPADGLT